MYLLIFIFESVPYFSPDCLDTSSPSIYLPPHVPLFAPISTPDLSSPVSPTNTTEPHVLKPLRVVTQQYTERPKVPPLNKFRPTPLFLKVHLLRQPSLLLTLKFLLLFEKVKSLILIPFLIFSYIRFTTSFRQFAISFASLSILTSYEEALFVPA